MILEKLTYDVKEAVKAYNDDSELDTRYIIYLYNIKRAKYLRQALNNYQRTVDNSIKQTLCLTLEEVDMSECSVDYDCGTLLRTTQVVPKPLELDSKVAITKVKPTTRISQPFNFISKSKAAYIDNAPYSNSIYAFIDVDNYIYVYSKSDAYKVLDCITVTGVFEDPLSLSAYTNCCGCTDSASVCYDEASSDYPLQPHFIDLIREEIIKDLIRGIQLPEDTENDGENS